MPLSESWPLPPRCVMELKASRMRDYDISVCERKAINMSKVRDLYIDSSINNISDHSVDLYEHYKSSLRKTCGFGWYEYLST